MRVFRTNWFTWDKNVYCFRVLYLHIAYGKMPWFGVSFQEWLLENLQCTLNRISNYTDPTDPTKNTSTNRHRRFLEEKTE